MRELKFAFKRTVPILFTYLFIGIAYGMLMSEAGYSAAWSFVSALFIFAGSMQIIMIPLMQAGTPLLTLAVMTFFVNARHLFYGIAFIEKFKKMGWKYPYMVLTLTDETYSVLCSIENDDSMDMGKAYFYIASLNHLYWITGCTIGALVGQFLKWDMSGIEFSATAFFTIVVINYWRKYPTKIPIFVGGISSIVFYILVGANSFLLPALSASLFILIFMKNKVKLDLGGLKNDN